MKRVLVVGCPGSGKSTFSKDLAQRTGLPLFHLDKIHWQEGWKEKEKALFVSEIGDIIKSETWILDGNYKGTLPLRLTRADTVIFLDLGRVACLKNAILRTIQSLGKVRDDMPDGGPERFDWEFTKYIWQFPRDYRPILVSTLKSFDKNIVRLRNFTEAGTYLASITSEE